jgi:hypothetical protein
MTIKKLRDESKVKTKNTEAVSRLMKGDKRILESMPLAELMPFKESVEKLLEGVSEEIVKKKRKCQ